ncbi:MAG: hypothetical protein FWG65_01810 [Turicibacter sp.]|nr:hypothetical protein [Turicibacter sp.]
MDYKDVFEHNGDVIVTGIQNFILSDILECGQCFRWRKLGTERYSGIAHGRLLEVYAEDCKFVLKSTTKAEFDGVWRSYFGLDWDYSKLKRIFSADKILAEAIEFSAGLRVMKQEIWEVLITFILSQNSNIPRITKMVEALCENFGKPLENGRAFPKPEELADVDLAPIRAGYREPYIADAVRRVLEKQLNLEELSTLPTTELRKKLLKIHGVGPKVADCVLLYGFGRVESYPMDVWMKRVMQQYPTGFPKEIENIAGIAQQFLFNHIRKGR